MFNACRGEKFSVFIPLSLFLLNPILGSIFFSLIFAQKLYIYLRTDSHYLKSLKQVSSFVKGFSENFPTSQEVREIASKFAGVESLKEALATRSLRETEQLQLLLSSA
ncbi:hypothetical protein MICAER10613_001420 [Microcystis aeruginosa]